MCIMYVKMSLLLMSGKEETEVEMFRSILAQLEFTYIVQKYDAGGIPFRTHLHVPEVHPLTESIFYEGEDEGHVVKVTMIFPNN